ncbi:hypothetical protein IGI04_027020, partial [Brassica rapa subsp. trilocularis]
SVHCCRWWSAPLPVPEASILFSFSSLFFVFFASAIRYARLLCGGWRAPAFDLYLSAIGLDSVAHVLYWSVGESRQWYRAVDLVVSSFSLVFALVGSGIAWLKRHLLRVVILDVGPIFFALWLWQLLCFRSSVKLECREASELYIRFSNTAAIKIFVSLWCSIGSRFFCGPLPLDRIIPVPLFWSLDHDMVASISMSSCHEVSSVSDGFVLRIGTVSLCLIRVESFFYL